MSHFLLLEVEAGGAYLWYFTVLMNVNGTSVLIHFNFDTLSRFTSNSNIFEFMLN